MKICSKCREEKALSEFSPDKRCGDGLQSRCKKCMCEAIKQYRLNNLEKFIEIEKRRYASDPEFYKKKTAKWRAENPDKVKKNHAEWYRANRDHSISKALNWQKKNPERFRENLRRSNERKRSTLKGRLNHNISSAVRHSLKDNAKAGRGWESLVDFTIDQLKAHLEKLFKPEMTWENYGTVWEIDHKVPVAVFNFEKPEHIDFRLCWNLKNLQPLEKSENRSKSAKIEEPFQPSLQIAAGEIS